MHLFLYSEQFVVSVLWLEEHLPEAWRNRASDIKEALDNESFTTISSICQATVETLRLIQVDGKPLQAGVIAALHTNNYAEGHSGSLLYSGIPKLQQIMNSDVKGLLFRLLDVLL